MNAILQKVISALTVLAILAASAFLPRHIKPGKPTGTTPECLVQLCTEGAKFDGEWLWQAAGMSYILRTSANRLIIVDGGGVQADAVHLLECAKALTGEEVPTVALWIITHPHLDHYGALLELSKREDLRKQVRIEGICYQEFPEPVLPRSGVSYAFDADHMQEIFRNLSVPIVRPRTGDTPDFDGMKIHFLYTPEDNYDRLRDVNEMSLIFQVIGQRKTAMFTGDAYERTTEFCLKNHPFALRSDYCQLAHHGLNGGSNNFYAAVHAKTVLIPISAAGERDVATWDYGTVPRQFAERVAKNVYKAFEGDLELPL